MDMQVKEQNQLHIADLANGKREPLLKDAQHQHSIMQWNTQLITYIDKQNTRKVRKVIEIKCHNTVPKTQDSTLKS